MLSPGIGYYYLQFTDDTTESERNQHTENHAHKEWQFGIQIQMFTFIIIAVMSPNDHESKYFSRIR